MKKRVKIILVILVIILAVLGGYYGYKYYQNIREINEIQSLYDSKAILEIFNRSDEGKIISFEDNKLTYQINFETEKEVQITEDIAIEKMIKNEELPDTYSLVEGSRDDIVVGKKVLIIYKNINEDTIEYIKIITP